MDGSNKRAGHIKRQSVAGMSLCAAGLGLIAWPVLSQFLGDARAPDVLFVALPVLTGLGLIVTGFGLMVAGAEPFEDDLGGVRQSDEQE